ncbi:hypothetical protein VUJ49_06220 [Pseudomonas berkeleyensis]|uniref:Uncharacterized protein n=1 Tax=Pseudomonas berkeleyensis TaxID=2726956 RepID=A0A7G5DSC5_9PSED|nr:hypothetical protein [Pseudomonas berkeleyensis]QMV64650.1 hypothetical protein HS968_06195 [Pseudomonas berkeleyensis]WSO40118.1 hypothetical protein VUJ49_06220 [Pseudomonas berkeleyensis]
MKRMLLALALAASPAFAEESKPVATQVGDALRPAAEAYGKGMQKLVNELFAGSKGPMGEAARSNLKAQDKREREANRGVRRTMKECIKPGNVIDDDVKECIEGLRTKEW